MHMQLTFARKFRNKDEVSHVSYYHSTKLLWHYFGQGGVAQSLIGSRTPAALAGRNASHAPRSNVKLMIPFHMSSRGLYTLTYRAQRCGGGRGLLFVGVRCFPLSRVALLPGDKTRPVRGEDK